MEMMSILEEDFETIFSKEIAWKEFDNQSILITGAYGMLASYLSYFFVFLHERKGINIRLLLQGRNKCKAISKLGVILEKEYVDFYDIDINSNISLECSVDYIIHAASLASSNYYVTNPIEVAEPNALGTYYLLRLASEKKVKKFLYFSSGDIYGKCIDDNKRIREETFGCGDSLDTQACYRESKRMGETWCRIFGIERNVPTVIARIAHTFGPTMDVENDPRVFSSFMKSLICEDNIKLRSNGLAYRPFCYIADATVAFLLLLVKGSDGEAYNVCNENGFLSIYDFAKLIVNISDNELAIEINSEYENTIFADNTNNIDNLLDSTKLRGLGWSPSYSIKEGLERTYKALQVGSNNDD